MRRLVVTGRGRSPRPAPAWARSENACSPANPACAVSPMPWPAPSRCDTAGRLARQVAPLRRFVPADACDMSLRRPGGL